MVDIKKGKTRNKVRKDNQEIVKESQSTEKQVGDKRTFTTPKGIFIIREILFNPGVSMNWVWNTGIDPKTKIRISKEMIHTFYRIEILSEEFIKYKDLKKEDIILLGDALDGRRMMLTIDKYDEVLGKSKTFKKLVGN